MCRIPFADASFEQIRGVHVIEHVGDIMATMQELHRLARPGGLIVLVTPHYTDFSSFCDPTHRWHLNSFSFRHFSLDDNAGYGFCHHERKLKERRATGMRLLAFWRWLGFEFLVNHSRRFRFVLGAPFLSLLRGARESDHLRVGGFMK